MSWSFKFTNLKDGRYFYIGFVFLLVYFGIIIFSPTFQEWADAQVGACGIFLPFVIFIGGLAVSVWAAIRTYKKGDTVDITEDGIQSSYYGWIDFDQIHRLKGRRNKLPRLILILTSGRRIYWIANNAES